MRTVTSKDSTPIAFDQVGQGPSLILVGGASTTRTDAASVAAALAPYFTVFAYDRRGRGDSGDTSPYAVEREVEDIESLLDAAGGTELRNRRLRCGGGRAHVCHQHGVGWRRKEIEIPDEGRTGKSLRFEFRVHNRHDGEPAVQRTDGRDLGKIGRTKQGNPGVAALARDLQRGHAVGLGTPEQRERIRHEFEGQPRLFGETAGRQIIGVAPGGRLADFDQPFLNATLEISVGKPEGDTELGRKPALGLLSAAFDVFQQPEDNSGLLNVAGL